MIELSGKTVLVVEDEPLIALELAQALTDLQAVVIGPFADVASATAAVRRHQPAIAVVDYCLLGKSAAPLIDLLASMRVPVVLHTGLNLGAELSRCPGMVVVPKPAGEGELIGQLARLLRQSSTSLQGAQASG